MADLYLSKVPPPSPGHPEATMFTVVRHEEVLDERLRRLVSGEDTAAPWKEAKERIRAQVKMPIALGAPHD
jgi:hypothetical protein